MQQATHRVQRQTDSEQEKNGIHPAVLANDLELVKCLTPEESKTLPSEDEMLLRLAHVELVAASYLLDRYGPMIRALYDELKVGDKKRAKIKRKLKEMFPEFEEEA